MSLFKCRMVSGPSLATLGEVEIHVFAVKGGGREGGGAGGVCTMTAAIGRQCR